MGRPKKFTHRLLLGACSVSNRWAFFSLLTLFVFRSSVSENPAQPRKFRAAPVFPWSGCFLNVPKAAIVGSKAESPYQQTHG
jgi:hypothetical protein